MEAFYKTKIALCGKFNDRGEKRALVTTEVLGETRHLIQHKVVGKGLLEKKFLS